jgi:hypothetical protein
VGGRAREHRATGALSRIWELLRNLLRVDGYWPRNGRKISRVFFEKKNSALDGGCERHILMLDEHILLRRCILR